MPTTLDTAATAELVRDLADLVCTKPDGTRWKNVSVTQMKNTCVRFCAEMVRRAGGELTLGELLTSTRAQAHHATQNYFNERFATQDQGEGLAGRLDQLRLRIDRLEAKLNRYQHPESPD